MAVINFYDDILGQISDTVNVESGIVINDAIHTHLDKKGKYKETVEIYNPNTEETLYKNVETDDYFCVIKVNDKEKDLNYVIQENDIIIIAFIPLSSEAEENAGNISVALGAIAFIGGVFGTFVPGLFALDLFVAAIGAMSVGVGALLIADSKDKGVNPADLEGKDLLSIKGGSNTSILNNKFPVVLGKHLINPYIIGSPYHETHVKDLMSGTDNGQYYKALYCLGYGPLKLTNFKIGDTILAYNTPSFDGNRNTVMHGQLRLKKEWIDDETYSEQNKNDTFEITKKWKNNDVKLEILQFGEYAEYNNEELKIANEYGSIYQQSVEEKEINASLLFAYDKSIKEAASIVYKNVEIPNGFRTNTVRFSHSCPTKIQVEIDAPSGLYGIKTKNDDNGRTSLYAQIPVIVAVQWRFASINEVPSDAEKGKGWKSFDYMLFDDEKKLPSIYTQAFRNDEIKFNEGLSKDTKAEQNPNWEKEPVFVLTNSNDSEKLCTDEEIIDLLEKGIIETSGKYTYHANFFTPLSSSPYVAIFDGDIEGQHYIVTDGYESVYRVDNKTDGKSNVYKISSKLKDDWFNSEVYKNNYNEDFNIKERRFVFEKNFTEEECRILSGYENSDFLDKVEVRVIRLTPSYIDQTESGNTIFSPASYQDLLKWTYLRTWEFDKEDYIEALRNDSSISVNDYLSRPVSEEDLKKFTFVALELKQDIAETGENSLKQFSCIAEAFAPKYNEIEDKWYPENIEEVTGYYHKIKENNKWKIEEISKDDYAELLNTDRQNCFWHKKGTTYLQTLKDDIKTGLNTVDDYSVRESGVVKYLLSDEVESKYITNNTASIALQSLFGSHLCEDAKTWSSVNKEAFTDFYLFNEDIIDKTPQDYKQNKNYICQTDLANPKRIKTKADMAASLWDDADEVKKNGWIYEPLTDTNYTTYTVGITDKNEENYWVLTPICENEDNFKVLTPGQLREQAELIYKGDETTEKCICAHFNGSKEKIIELGSIYSESLHIIQDMYLINKDKYQRYFDKFIELPVNAVQSGCYNDVLYSFLKDYDDVNIETLKYSILYQFAYSNNHTETFYTEPCKTIAEAEFLMNLHFEDVKAVDKTLQQLIDIGCYIKICDHNGNIIEEVPPTNAGTIRYLFTSKDKEPENYDAELWSTFGKEDIDLSQGNYLWIRSSVVPRFYRVKLTKESVPRIYKDMFINVMEQMKMFKEADGYRHVSYKTNAVINKEIKFETLMQKIMLTARSFLNRNDFNQYEPLIGRPNPYPVTVLSQRNCISKSNARSFSETPSGYLVPFVDENDNYEKNEFYVMDKGEKWWDPTKKIDNFNLDYVTDMYQMANLALFNLACKLYQRESYTRTVGRLGMGISLGDTLLLQDDSLLIGSDNGGRIQRLIEDDQYIYGFITDDAYHYTGENQAVTIIQPEQYGKSRCVTLRLADLDNPEYKSGINIPDVKYEHKNQDGGYDLKYVKHVLKKGLTNVVIFNTKVSKNDYFSEDIDAQFVMVQPEVDNLVVFGEANTITEKVVITGIKPSKNNYELSLVPYNEDLYFSGSEIPIFQPKMSVPEREIESFAFSDIPSKALQAEKEVADYNSLLEEVSSQLSRIYSNHIITLYKKSDTAIADVEILHDIIYDFSTDELYYINEEGSQIPIDNEGIDGWFLDIKYLASIEGDIYITTATAFGIEQTATITPDKWATPVSTGKNGVSTATITLYQRSTEQPITPEDIVTYTFGYKTIDGNLGNWTLNVPTSNGSPLWVTSATVASSKNTDEVQPSEWSTPTIMITDGKDGGYQDYIFYVGDFGLTDDELYEVEWSDSPGEIPDGKCLYMATKWIK